MRVASVTDNVISYDPAISVCEIGGQWQDSNSTLPQDAVSDRAIAHDISHNAAISAFAKGCVTGSSRCEAWSELDKVSGSSNVEQGRECVPPHVTASSGNADLSTSEVTSEDREQFEHTRRNIIKHLSKHNQWRSQSQVFSAARGIIFSATQRGIHLLEYEDELQSTSCVLWQCFDHILHSYSSND